MFTFDVYSYPKWVTYQCSNLKLHKASVLTVSALVTITECGSTPNIGMGQFYNGGLYVRYRSAHAKREG